MTTWFKCTINWEVTLLSIWYNIFVILHLETDWLTTEWLPLLYGFFWFLYKTSREVVSLLFPPLKVCDCINHQLNNVWYIPSQMDAEHNELTGIYCIYQGNEEETTRKLVVLYD